MVPERVCRLLTAYVDGELAPEQCEQVGELVRQSAEARDLLQKLQEDADRLRALPRQTLEPLFAEQLLTRIADGRLPSRPVPAVRRRTPASAWVALAAAACLLLTVGVASYQRLTAPGRLQTGQESAGVVEGVPIPAPGVVADATPNPRQAPTLAKKASPHKSADETTSKLPDPPKTIVETRPPQDPSKALGSPPVTPTPFRRERSSVPVAFRLREIDQEARKQAVREALSQGSAYKIEVDCRDTTLAAERLAASFKVPGLRLDVDAASRNIPFPQTTYVLFVENITPDEGVAILEQLAATDRMTEKVRDVPRFNGLEVKPMSDADRKLVGKALGVDPDEVQFPESKPKSDAPAGPGARRNTERTAILVANGQPAQAKPSEQVQSFVSGRRAPEPGTLQLLIVVRQPVSPATNHGRGVDRSQ